MSVIQSRKVSAIQRLLCTVNYDLGPPPLVCIVEDSVYGGPYFECFTIIVSML